MVAYASNSSAADAVVSSITALPIEPAPRAVAIRADVANTSEIVTLFDSAIAHFGRIDIVISNAGVQSAGHISTITPEVYDREFAINTRGQLFVAQQAYKHLPSDGSGRLILTSTTTTQAQTVKNHSVYAGSKAAPECWARHLANGMRFTSNLFYTSTSV